MTPEQYLWTDIKALKSVYSSESIMGELVVRDIEELFTGSKLRAD